MPTPSSTGSCTTRTASILSATACAGPDRNQPQRIDLSPATRQKQIHQQDASSGPHRVGTASDIISEQPGNIVVNPQSSVGSATRGALCIYEYGPWKAKPAEDDQLKRAIIRSGLEALYVMRAHRWLGAACGGAGVILTLHHVRPATAEPFQPSRAFEITPEFLEATLGLLRRHGLEAVSLDEMAERLRRGGGGRRMVCLTFDDGYRDNLEWAYPILKRHGIPFTIYVTSGVPDRQPCLWWRTVEKVVAAVPEIDLTVGGKSRPLVCRTTAEKYAAVAEVHRMLRALADETRLREAVSRLAGQAVVDECSPARELGLSWKELRELAADPLVTIGAHTVSHPLLRNLPASEARREMEEGATRIRDMLGVAAVHMSYPFGDAAAAGPREFALARELGFATAVTTRPGMLRAEYGGDLWALPRISLAGDMQRLRYLDVLISGAGTAAWNLFQRDGAA
jgi:peptidoglycan/xylan/chitin deacetylase (PgdA/CDA1 family)